MCGLQVRLEGQSSVLPACKACYPVPARLNEPWGRTAAELPPLCAPHSDTQPAAALLLHC
jgi:hypothetical protein